MIRIHEDKDLYVRKDTDLEEKYTVWSLFPKVGGANSSEVKTSKYSKTCFLQEHRKKQDLGALFVAHF